MPQTITNQEILDLLASNVAELDSINAENEVINKRCFELNKAANRFTDLMNAEYGWGKWHDVDAKNLTFVTPEEFDKNLYVIANPAIHQKVECTDAEVIESSPIIEEEVTIEEFKELYPDHEAFKEGAEESFAVAKTIQPE